jgi:hypothetical protein
MSKRARITLHPDSEPAEIAPPDDPATEKPSEIAAKAETGPSAGRDAKAKARVGKEKEPARKPRVRSTPKPHTAEAKGAGPAPASGNRRHRPESDAAYKPDDDFDFQNTTTKASQPPAPPRGIPDLGTMLKIVAPGLVAAAIAVAVVFWMKRKPR